MRHELEMIESSPIPIVFEPEKHNFPRASGPNMQIQIHMQESL